MPRRLLRRARHAAGTFPGQFWLVLAATFVYLGSSALVFPHFGIYLTERMGVRRTEGGLVLGLARRDPLLRVAPRAGSGHPDGEPSLTSLRAV